MCRYDFFPIKALITAVKFCMKVYIGFKSGNPFSVNESLSKQMFTSLHKRCIVAAYKTKFRACENKNILRAFVQNKGNATVTAVNESSATEIN